MIVNKFDSFLNELHKYDIDIVYNLPEKSITGLYKYSSSKHIIGLEMDYLKAFIKLARQYNYRYIIVIDEFKIICEVKLNEVEDLEIKE